jgi:hypothetical protein
MPSGARDRRWSFAVGQDFFFLGVLQVFAWLSQIQHGQVCLDGGHEGLHRNSYKHVNYDGG